MIDMPSSLPPECHYWSGSCSPDVSYCLLECSGPCLPFSVLVSIMTIRRILTQVFVYSSFIDNVHFQNTAQLVHVLTEKEVQFRLQVIASYHVTIASSYICLQFYTD